MLLPAALGGKWRKAVENRITSEDAMYSLSVMLEIDPDQREEFKAVAVRHAANTRASEKGCLGFEVYESPDNPSRFYFHEVYADRAALTEVHDKSPYLAEYLAKTAGWIRSRVREEWNSVEP